MVSYPRRLFFMNTDTVEDSVLVGCDAVTWWEVHDIWRAHSACPHLRGLTNLWLCIFERSWTTNPATQCHSQKTGSCSTLLWIPQALYRHGCCIGYYFLLNFPVFVPVKSTVCVSGMLAALSELLTSVFCCFQHNMGWARVWDHSPSELLHRSCGSEILIACPLPLTTSHPGHTAQAKCQWHW